MHHYATISVFLLYVLAYLGVVFIQKMCKRFPIYISLRNEFPNGDVFPQNLAFIQHL